MPYLGIFRLELEKNIVIFETSVVAKFGAKTKILKFETKWLIWVFLDWNFVKK